MSRKQVNRKKLKKEKLYTREEALSLPLSVLRRMSHRELLYEGVQVKRFLFAFHYSKDGIAKHAALKAGYAECSAAVTGRNLSKDDGIRELVTLLKYQELQVMTPVKRKEVLSEIIEDDEESTYNRLKAIDLLNKMTGIYREVDLIYHDRKEKLKAEAKNGNSDDIIDGNPKKTPMVIVETYRDEDPESSQCSIEEEDVVIDVGYVKDEELEG